MKNPLLLGASRFGAISSPQAEQREATALSSSLVGPAPSLRQEDAGPFSVGSLLAQGRYRLIEQVISQRWTHGVYETYWHAQDLFQKEMRVTICEMDLPALKAVDRQTCLITAIRTFSSLDGQSFVPPLLDVFRDHGRDCLVFRVVEGETLMARMQRTGRTLSEQEAIDCCLQVTEALTAFTQRKVPLIHGFICPENLVVTGAGRWRLTNFSLVLASSAGQYFPGLHLSHPSPFTAPEVSEGIITGRADLYSLLATACYGITGRHVRGQDLYTLLSPSLAAIFAKGLQRSASQGYQYSSELLRDLQPLQQTPHSASATRNEQRAREKIPSRLQSTRNISHSGNWQEEQQRPVMPLKLQQETRVSPLPYPAGPVLSPLTAFPAPDESPIAGMDVLPRPEDLPPLPPGHDLLAAALWIIGLLVCFSLPVVLK